MTLTKTPGDATEDTNKPKTNKIMDHLEERLRSLGNSEGHPTISEQYELRLLNSIFAHYDDLEDLLHLQKALNNINRLLTDQIEDGIDALMEVPKLRDTRSEPPRKPNATLYEVWTLGTSPEMEHWQELVCEIANQEGSLERTNKLKELYPEIFTELNYYK